MPAADTKRACEGASTAPIRIVEHMEECRVCKTAVRFDLVNHPFWGFKSTCSKPKKANADQP